MRRTLSLSLMLLLVFAVLPAAAGDDQEDIRNIKDQIKDLEHRLMKAERHAGADRVIPGRDTAGLLAFLRETAPSPASPGKRRTGHALISSRPSAAVRASRGCTRRCPYCAAPLLDGPLRRRKVTTVLDELALLVEEKGVKHVAFYDDALLEEGADRTPERSFRALAEGIPARKLNERARLHCPNALSARSVTGEVARLLRRAGFDTIRLGFETADPVLQKVLGGKVDGDALASAVEHLRSAGYMPGQIGVYLLAGLPGQDPESVDRSMEFVHRAGATVRLAEYAPVPGTPLFEEARKRSGLDLEEPLLHNKTLAPYRFPEFPPQALRRLKDRARELNRAFRSG